nr:DUF2059 domain-containing protein [Dyella soli]
MRWGAALALAMGAGQSLAASAPASEQQVRQLMEVVGVGKMLSQMNTQAVGMMQQSLPCVPGDYWQNYVDANGTQQFIGRLVPVYQRHFSSDELEGLLKFYRSPLGQKVINEMPTTMAEASQAGQQWSHERSDQMIAELKQKGSLDANGRCPAKVGAAGPVIGAGALAAGAAAKAGDEDTDEGPAKAASTAKPKAKAPARKSTKPPVKKAASKAPAKTEAKTDAKAPAQPAANTPAGAKPAPTGQ